MAHFDNNKRVVVFAQISLLSFDKKIPIFIKKLKLLFSLRERERERERSGEGKRERKREKVWVAANDVSMIFFHFKNISREEFCKRQ